MYLVLVTNKNSNILEDLETLRLCGKVVPEYVEALEEEEVRRDWGLPLSLRVRAQEWPCRRVLSWLR